MTSLTRAADNLSRAPILIDDTPAMSLREVRAKARRFRGLYSAPFRKSALCYLCPGAAGPSYDDFAKSFGGFLPGEDGFLSLAVDPACCSCRA